MRKIQAWLCVLTMAGVLGCSNSETGGSTKQSTRGVGDGEETGSGAESVGMGARAASGKSDSPAGVTPGAGSFGSATPASGTPSPAPTPTTPSASAPPSMAPAPIGTSSGPSSVPPPSSGAAGDASTTRPVQSGTLTAGTWDDNRNFDRFLAYRAKQSGRGGIVPLTDDEHADAHEEFATVHGARELLDVSLVIDTTGSMSDEIQYLQTEFLALSRAIEADYPDSQQRWSLVVYRDEGDVYVTRWFDFRDDVNDFRTQLSAQFADGGGDFPEAPDAALAAMNQLAWRAEENTARLAFWVADAPHHENNAKAMADALRGSRDLDVHIYPVASSGIDEFTELTMRTAAQFTGGRYLFLTNDSGVGGDHKEPSIPCYFVTRLDQAILRMVRIELSGEYSEPSADDIVRRGGNPQAGSCQLESGDVVEVF